MDVKMKVSIVMPAYNEEKRIGPTLQSYLEYFSYLKKQKKLDYEILVVINNTKDATEKVVKSFQKKYKNLIYLNLVNGGKGYAVMEGFKDALKRDNDIIGFVDADLSTPPESFEDLIKRIDKADAVIASRYIKGSIISAKQNLKRIFFSRVYNLAARAMFVMPYRDTQCGAKLFRRKSVEYLKDKIKIAQYAFDVDLLYNLRRGGFTILEAPTKWYEKQQSTINKYFNTGVIMFLAILRLRLLNSPLKDIVRAYNKLVNAYKNLYK